jgi:DNA gyrase/topoisomerase IV subunit A
VVKPVLFEIIVAIICLTSRILSCIHDNAGAAAELTANQLMKYTSMQSRFSCNMVALVDGLPKSLDLKEFLQAFLKFRRVGLLNKVNLLD